MVNSYEDDMSPFPSKIILIFVEQKEWERPAQQEKTTTNKDRRHDWTIPRRLEKLQENRTGYWQTGQYQRTIEVPGTI
jgi:hypothetical protein